MTRRGKIVLATIVVGLMVWLNAHLPSEESMLNLPNGGAGVTCYEDGSCTDGYCDPNGLCNK